jgi:hypothetical protein
MKPAHVPQVKNGEQPGHSFSLDDDLLACSFFITASLTQSLSEQQGFAESDKTKKDNIRQKNFTP